MIDLETMGTKSYSAILSIAAVEFDIVTGETGKSFYKNIELKSNVDNGLKICPETVEWWLGQNESAKKSLFIEKESLSKVLWDFKEFCDNKYFVWGNSARFDLGILSNAYDKIGDDAPWDHRKERCVRTLVSFYPNIKDKWVFEGVKHHPVDDCLNQIGYCSKIWKKLKF